MEAANKRNVYVCPNGHRTVTVNRDEGVTPFLINCPDLSCDALAKSSLYRVDQSLTPKFEWYRPGDAELAALEPSVQQHVNAGGLIKRRISTDDLERRYGVLGPRQG